MKDESKLLEFLTCRIKNIYSTKTSIEEENAIELSSIEDLLNFSLNNDISTIFYHYVLIDEDNLLIDDDIMSEFKLDDISALQHKIEEYNKNIKNLDFTDPISLYVFCLFQGYIFYIREDDYWFINDGICLPEIAAMNILNESIEDIYVDNKEKNEAIEEGRSDLRQKILNDVEFHKCTNSKFRHAYISKLIHENPEYKRLFSYNNEAIFIPISTFIEEIWRDYKEMRK